MKMSILLRYTFLMCLMITNSVFSQVKNSTSVIKKTEKTVNTYNNKSQKEPEKATLKLVFSDRNNNYIYEEPYGAKINSTANILSPLYVISEEKNYYEVVVADKKMIGKPKGTLAVIRSKKNHFSNAKEVQYLGWIKKENVIEYSRPMQNQANLKYVKYFVGCNTIDNLLVSNRNVKKEALILKNEPNLETPSKKNIKLNDFVYVYKINKTTKSAFVSNFDDITAKDTVNLKCGWIPLQYLNPIEDDMVLKLNPSDTLYLPSVKMTYKGAELYKNTLFLNENQSSQSISFNKPNKIVLPVAVWNHDKNKITNIKGDDISIKTIEQIANQSKNINFFYVFENNNATQHHLKKILSALQNLKLTTSNELYSNYNFTYSFIAKGTSRSYYLIKSDSFSKWFDLIEKSIKTPDEISSGNMLSNSKTDIGRFLSSETNFENNFFILAGSDSSINSVLPDSFNLLARNNAKLLFILFENENTVNNQDFILQSKMYLNEASNANKRYVENYYVDPKLITKNDEFNYTGASDNDYIYDAPQKSNFNGGILFPKLNKELTPETINKAIDTIISKTIKTNNNLLKSLTQYKNEFSFLRSRPSQKISDLIQNFSQSDSINTEIPKNYKNETFIINAKDTLNADLEDKLNILLTENDIKQLIENYRELVSKEYTNENVDEVEILNFKDKCKMLARNIKKTEKIKPKNTLADLFYFKTRVLVNSCDLHEIRIKDIKKFQKRTKDFRSLFINLNAKLEILEKIQRNNAFEVFDDEAQPKYYYLPKKLLL